MKIPYVLRAPSYPAVVPVDVLTGARPLHDEDVTPEEALRLSQRAADAGWQVLVTYAQARGTKLHRVPVPAEDGRKYAMEPYECSISTVAVRLLNPGVEMRIAIWRDGAFDVGLRLLPQGLIKVGAVEIKDLSGSVNAGSRAHRCDDGWLRHEHDR